MSGADPSHEAVEATAKELRERGTELIADMLDALLARAENAEAERDDAQKSAQSWRDKMHNWMKIWRGEDHANKNLRTDLTAARETIAAKDAEIANLAEQLALRSKSALAKELQRVMEMHNANLEYGTVTIARLTAEVQAAREALERLSSSEVFTPEALGWTHPEFVARIEFARDAIRARTNPKEPTT